MFIQKTLHVDRTLEDTKARFSALPIYRRGWEGVDRAEFRDGEAEIEFNAGLGVEVKVLVEALPSDNPNEILFHSCHGNIALYGMIEFTAIRERLTEVTLTLDYTMKDSLRAFVNGTTGAINGFVVAQLGVIEPLLKGEVETEPAAVYGESAPALSICLR
jgi:hypothetical protein